MFRAHSNDRIITFNFSATFTDWTQMHLFWGYKLFEELRKKNLPWIVIGQLTLIFLSNAFGTTCRATVLAITDSIIAHLEKHLRNALTNHKCVFIVWQDHRNGDDPLISLLLKWITTWIIDSSRYMFLSYWVVVVKTSKPVEEPWIITVATHLALLYNGSLCILRHLRQKSQLNGCNLKKKKKSL